MKDDELAIVAMEVILHAGNARNLIRKSGELVSKHQIENVEEMLKEAKQEIVLAHKSQTQLLHREARGEKVEMTVLFSHAQDTLMTTESECFMIETLFNFLKKE